MRKMTYKFKNELKGQRISLKMVEPTIECGKEKFELIDSNREHLKFWFEWVAGTKKVEDTLKFLFIICDEISKGEKAVYGIYLENKLIGDISIFNLSEQKRSGEIGYWMSKDYTQKGYMTEAVKILESEAFETQGLNRIVIQCDERNIASSGVAKKCEYQFEGKLREDSLSSDLNNFRNTLIFSKLKSDYDKQK